MDSLLERGHGGLRRGATNASLLYFLLTLHLGEYLISDADLCLFIMRLLHSRIELGRLPELVLFRQLLQVLLLFVEDSFNFPRNGLLLRVPDRML